MCDHPANPRRREPPPHPNPKKRENPRPTKSHASSTYKAQHTLHPLSTLPSAPFRRTSEPNHEDLNRQLRHLRRQGVQELVGLVPAALPRRRARAERHGVQCLLPAQPDAAHRVGRAAHDGGRGEFFYLLALAGYSCRRGESRARRGLARKQVGRGTWGSTLRSSSKKRRAHVLTAP
jgi:hypothetical protein